MEDIELDGLPRTQITCKDLSMEEELLAVVVSTDPKSSLFYCIFDD